MNNADPNTSVAPEAVLVPDQFAWLADAPLFIDAQQIDSFYDAVVRPDSREGVTKIQDKEGKIRQWTGQVAAELKATPGPLVRALAPIFPFLVEGKVGGTAGGTHGTTTE